MTKAKATIEHANNGQMGQPAACMMVNKANTPDKFGCLNYGLVTHPHELWITLGISFVATLLKPHEWVDSTE
jgi:hypothetical protein